MKDLTLPWFNNTIRNRNVYLSECLAIQAQIVSTELSVNERAMTFRIQAEHNNITGLL